MIAMDGHRAQLHKFSLLGTKPPRKKEKKTEIYTFLPFFFGCFFIIHIIMSSRLARQSLELLTASPKTKIDNTEKQKSSKVKLPKINKGIKKVKHEIRYGRHQKTRLMQEEIRKRENPIGINPFFPLFRVRIVVFFWY
jgi:hypothetical protein